MKPRKAILTAAAVTALFSAGGCSLNEVQCVYGAPVEQRPYSAAFETGETSDFVPEDNMMHGMYGVPDYREPVEFRAEDNMEEDVYGPPLIPVTEEPYDTDEIAEFDPYDNINQPEYGCPIEETAEPAPTEPPHTELAETTVAEPTALPPEIEESEETEETGEDAETSCVYPEPTAEYDPRLNMEMCVYGPPEWFEQRRNKQ